ncbi:hypothetical protein DID88_007956 [Monilinia fructigena]|uniref:Copper acquisition factor BIM1-like domain-containing protein n=1 Tax=Monilinia fructigena TaxID=38457 RepID=A0A395J4U4_9HELO|nr:hypothetical protein DID88_007956 [Monilinia fructigena]
MSNKDSEESTSSSKPWRSSICTSTKKPIKNDDSLYLPSSRLPLFLCFRPLLAPVSPARGDSFLPPASQWVYPCANINTTENRTVYPTDSFAIGVELHHNWTYMFVNLGLAENGLNATIQVVTVGQSGSALYNCADITFSPTPAPPTQKLPNTDAIRVEELTTAASTSSTTNTTSSPSASSSSSGERSASTSLGAVVVLLGSLGVASLLTI